MLFLGWSGPNNQWDPWDSYEFYVKQASIYMPDSMLSRHYKVIRKYSYEIEDPLEDSLFMFIPDKIIATKKVNLIEVVDSNNIQFSLLIDDTLFEILDPDDYFKIEEFMWEADIISFIEN